MNDSDTYRKLFSDLAKLREQTGHALKKSEELMKLAFRGTSDVVWDWDMAAGKVTLIQGWQEMSGYWPGEGESDFSQWKRKVHPEDLPVFEGALDAYLQGRSDRFEPEYRIRTGTRGWKWVWTRGRCVEWDSGGRPLRMVGTHIDITGRKKTERKVKGLSSGLEEAGKKLEAEIAHHRQAAKAARKSQELFSAMFEASPVTCAISSISDGRFVYINKAFEQTLGYRREDVIGRTSLELGLWKSTLQREKAVEKLKNDKELRDYEVHMTDASGMTRDLIFSARIIDYRGEPHLLTMAVDITERKLMVEALRKAKSGLEARVKERTAELVQTNMKLRAEIADRTRVERELRIKEYAIATSINAIAFMDLDGVLTYVNCSLMKMMGYDHTGEIVGRHAREFSPAPERIESILKYLHMVGIWTGEIPLLGKDGSRLYTYTSGSIVRDEKGMPVCIMVSFINITERRRAEEQIRESEKKYRTLVQTIPYGVQISDRDGEIVLSNPAHHRILGREDGELVGMHIWDLMVSEDERANLKEYYRMLITKQPPPATFYAENRTGDGRLIDVQVNWDYMRNAKGELEGICSIISDITERRRMEEEKDRLLHELREALDKVKVLSGMLPICTSCKKIRDDSGHWDRLEDFISEHSDAEFSLHTCPSCTGKLYPGDEGAEKKLLPLSEREKEVLNWIKQGKTNWEISRILGISESTVRYHATNIIQKLDAVSRIHAVAIAVELGILSREE